MLYSATVSTSAHSSSTPLSLLSTLSNPGGGTRHEMQAYHALCEYRAAPVHAAALRLLRLLGVDPAGRASIHGVGGGGGGDAGAQQADTAHVLAHCVARATGSLPSMQLHTTRVHQQVRCLSRETPVVPRVSTSMSLRRRRPVEMRTRWASARRRSGANAAHDGPTPRRRTTLTPWST